MPKFKKWCYNRFIFFLAIILLVVFYIKKHYSSNNQRIGALKHEIYRTKSVGLLSLSLFRILSVVLDK